jgi:hypothetical protein
MCVCVCDDDDDDDDDDDGCARAASRVAVVNFVSKKKSYVSLFFLKKIKKNLANPLILPRGTLHPALLLLLFGSMITNERTN